MEVGDIGADLCYTTIMANQHNCMKWSEADLDFLCKNAGKMSANKIASSLSVPRTHSVVVKKIRKMKLPVYKGGFVSTWTPQQIDAFNQHLSDMTALQFANKYHLSRHQVYHRCKQENVKFCAAPLPLWSPDKVSLIVYGSSAKDIAAQTGINQEQVLRKAKALNVLLRESKGFKASLPKPEKAASKPRDRKRDIPAPRKRPESVYVSRIEYCPICCAPVSNWEDHWERMPKCHAHHWERMRHRIPAA